MAAPELLVLDEPTTGLDPVSKARLLLFFSQLNFCLSPNLHNIPYSLFSFLVPFLFH